MTVNCINKLAHSKPHFLICRIYLSCTKYTLKNKQINAVNDNQLHKWTHQFLHLYFSYSKFLSFAQNIDVLEINSWTL